MRMSPCSYCGDQLDIEAPGPCSCTPYPKLFGADRPSDINCTRCHGRDPACATCRPLVVAKPIALPKTPGHRTDCECLYCTQDAGFRCSACKHPVNDAGECTSCFDRPTPPATPVKDTNPKDAIGAAKVGTRFIPSRVLGEIGLALLEGACKYGAYNWRVAGVRYGIYYDAAVGRHLAAFQEGQDIDPASGLSHITKAIAGLIVLRDSMLQGNWQDDRPPRGPDVETWIEAMNAKAAEIMAKYPSPKEPFTQRKLDGE